MKKFMAVFAGAMLPLALSTAAWAHPKLISSTPAANATINSTKRIALSFSERLIPRMSGFELAMTGMPGMAKHAPMKLSGFKTQVAADGKSLVAVFPKPLAAGTYKLGWHVVSADTHRITGSLGFTVR